ncbi:MAG: LysE family translocator [Bacteroidales bacterium]|nr:LysE family translocator [Bacteroidales bacterium]
MHLAQFLIASVALTLLPGPDILFVMTQSLTRNARAGIAVAIGLCTGLFVHISAAAFGISLMIANTPWLFKLIMYAGVAYMLYMGTVALVGFFHPVAAEESILVKDDAKMSYVRLYRTGIIMNVLNPKVIFFFLAFLPQFLTDGSEHPVLDIFLLGGIFILQAILIFSLVSVIAGWISSKLAIQAIAPRKLSMVRAVVYFAIAVLFLLQ